MYECFSLFIFKTLMSAMILSQTNATPVLCAPILKDRSCVAALWDTKETEGHV